MPKSAVPAGGEAMPARCHDLISDLEGAIAVSRGLADAICQLSEIGEHRLRCVGAIHAISWPLLDELKAAKDTVVALYELYFENQKSGKTGK
jgi:hypothetical protein